MLVLYSVVSVKEGEWLVLVFNGWGQKCETCCIGCMKFRTIKNHPKITALGCLDLLEEKRKFRREGEFVKLYIL